MIICAPCDDTIFCSQINSLVFKSSSKNILGCLMVANLVWLISHDEDHVLLTPSPKNILLFGIDIQFITGTIEKLQLAVNTSWAIFPRRWKYHEKELQQPQKNLKVIGWK